MSALTQEMLLEFSGEEKPQDVRMVVLRGMGLTDAATLALASNLTSVSLSHNSLTALPLPASSLPSLTELNVNYNQLSSLSFLAACPTLHRLFAARNTLTSLAPLEACAELHAVCVSGNSLEDLGGCLAPLKRLTALEELELDGNPCGAHPSYRALCVDAAPALRMLDAEAVLPGERERARQVAKFEGRAVEGGSFYTHSDIQVPVGGSAPRPLRR
eukprot:CAMPEP_0174918548 /NCGR_PEP_ID=MMETSP1355-20121228/3142_1 /TAXON_ID=464990 /ORGANISM="Hemiselmis tepida, Strain CCMP443" /LENGTH=215 /DNA_ID=CAMNT_0016163727 /DNA_START=72 /DNA_END=715 /DNA_ORIENTATION=-